MPQVEVTFVGRLEIGKEGENRIKSPLETDEAVNEYVEDVKANVVKADSVKCAVCMDGRCAYCTAANIQPDGLLPAEKVEVRKLPKTGGGLYDMMTTSALLAGWSGFGSELDTYEKAYEVVAKVLDEAGYEDGGHTTNLSFNSDENMECGAWMKKHQGMEKGMIAYEESSKLGKANALDAAVNGFNGFPDPNDIMANDSYQTIRANQKKLVASGIFRDFDPIQHLRNLMAKNPNGVELLESDHNSPTHGHKEYVFVINEVEGTTIDRDAMENRPFVDDRWIRRATAKILAATSEEEERLLMAGDVVSVDVGDELVAPGLPVLLLTPA